MEADCVEISFSFHLDDELWDLYYGTQGRGLQTIAPSARINYNENKYKKVILSIIKAKTPAYLYLLSVNACLVLLHYVTIKLALIEPPSG